ncbi:DUF4148 domain-containing protein [Burkholderia sp. Ax-1719]|uniref:DUF4148 domain-containing protein n=1 Tax=Burkholderia sp. Ax-1719 TaxID=2608334 RepID=UPI0014220059|nr:DUF4148 domain-containing protein [Burkholderia sp. Ax-1719]NIE63078.1 DUF4148 domain-containing protein [Burkholderia sp. Ax-1719]
MKIKAIIIGAVLASSYQVGAFAQSAPQGLTRAQVIEDLKALESVGYFPGRASRSNYPEDIQAAEARLRAKQAASGTVAVQR